MTAILAFRRPRGLAGDIVLAAVVFVVTVALSAVSATPADRALWPGGVALIAVVSAALALRRRHPPAVLVVATLLTPLYYPLGFPDGPVGLVFLVALFTTAVESRLWVALGAVIAINAAFVGVAALRGSARTWNPSAAVDPEAVAALSVMLLGTVAAGHYVRSRRALLAAAERRATEAERDREAEARRRAVEERLRIARELHDVLAHQISLINVQAGAALHRRDDPERAYASLEAIKQASKQTLRELRGVLGVLRQVDEQADEHHERGGAGGGAPADGVTDGDGDGGAEPAPSLARLDGLLERARAAGLPVRRAGPVSDAALAGLLAPPVALAGYRIVQEALTNAVRHAGAGAVTVAIRFTGDEAGEGDGGAGAVIVQIDDDGTGAADPAALERGNGLRGMRERAAAVGGALSAGPAPGGGFRVRARLPVMAADEAEEPVRQARRAEQAEENA